MAAEKTIGRVGMTGLKAAAGLAVGYVSFLVLDQVADRTGLKRYIRNLINPAPITPSEPGGGFDASLRRSRFDAEMAGMN